MSTRRGFIKSTGALALFAAGIGGVPGFIARAANSNKIISPYKKKALPEILSLRIVFIHIAWFTYKGFVLC